MRYLIGIDVGTTGTKTILIDEQGNLRNEWRKVKVDGHVEEVLQAIKNCS